MLFNKSIKQQKYRNKMITKEIKKIPKTTLDTLPYLRAYENGVLELENNKFSKTLKFEDISFSLAREEDQLFIFKNFCKMLNGLNDSTLQFTIVNNKIEVYELLNNIKFDKKNDDLDILREEINCILKDNIEAGKSNYKKELYATLTVSEDNIKEANISLDRELNSLKNNLIGIGSDSTVLDLRHKLQVLHGILNKSETFTYNKDVLLLNGLGSKSIIAPNYLEFNNNHIVINDKYARVLYLKNYANYITDNFLEELINSSMESIISIYIEPMSKAKAIKMTNNKITEMMSEKLRNKNNFVPLELQNKIKATEMLYTNLSKQNQKFFFSTFTIFLSADSLDELNENTKEFYRISEENACTMSVLNFQQEEGLINTLPLGLNKLKIKRGLNTESMAITSLPFSSVELLESGGIYFGRNSLSNKLLVLNKDNLNNSNMFIFGVPGSGKSFLEKFQSIGTFLKTNDYFIIGDVEGEFVELTKKLKGQVIEISSQSETMINIMDLQQLTEEAIINKCNFITIIFKCLLRYEIDVKEEGILNRATIECYKKILETKNLKDMPTIEDLKNNLKNLNSDLHEYLDIFINGNLKNFNTQRRFDIDNRFICFNLKYMEESNKKLALLIVINSMWGAITRNYEKKIRTNIILEEFKSIVSDQRSVDMLDEIVSKNRKYGGSSVITSQNIKASLANKKVESMISNSEILVLMKQSKMDAKALQNSVLNLTDEQINSLIANKTGDGLLVYGNKIVPFTNIIEKDTNIYKLLNTNFNELRGKLNEYKY